MLYIHSFLLCNSSHLDDNRRITLKNGNYSCNKSYYKDFSLKASLEQSEVK